jgi:hypothetical protein
MRSLKSVLSSTSNDQAALLKDVDQVSTIQNAKEVEDFIDFISGKGTDIRKKPETTAIRNFVKRNGPLAFVNMDRLMVGLQLVTRIIDHNRIQQKQHSLCGPVSLMHDFAKRDPAGYVDYVIGLAENRRGYIGNHKVKIRKGSNILTKTVYRYGTDIHIQEADYIAMASLRDAASLLPYRAMLTSTMLQGATGSAQVKSWMEDMGFSKIHDRTLTRLWAPVAKAINVEQTFKTHVDGAKKQVDKGRVVILCSAGQLTQHQLGQTIGKGFSDRLLGAYLGGHWMLCRGVEFDTQGVRFALDSWGESSDSAGIGAVPQLPWSKVTSWYRGYVSGQP